METKSVTPNDACDLTNYDPADVEEAFPGD